MLHTALILLDNNYAKEEILKSFLIRIFPFPFSPILLVNGGFELFVLLLFVGYNSNARALRIR